MTAKQIVILIVATIAGFAVGMAVPIIINANHKIASIEEAKSILGEAVDSGESKELAEINENMEDLPGKKVDPVDSFESPEESNDPINDEIENNESDNSDGLAKKTPTVGAITITFDPSEVMVLGKPLKAGVIEELYQEYGFGLDTEYATKDLDSNNEITASKNVSVDIDGVRHEEGYSISIHDKNNKKSINLYSSNWDRNKNEAGDVVTITLSLYSNDGYDAGFVEFVNEYVRVPFVCGDENAAEEVFHMQEIMDSTGYKDGFEIPFESNYNDTKISKSVWGDNDENLHYELHIGDYTIALDKADYTNGLYLASYSYKYSK